MGFKIAFDIEFQVGFKIGCQIGFKVGFKIGFEIGYQMGNQCTKTLVCCIDFGLRLEEEERHTDTDKHRELHS